MYVFIKAKHSFVIHIVYKLNYGVRIATTKFCTVESGQIGKNTFMYWKSDVFANNQYVRIVYWIYVYTNGQWCFIFILWLYNEHLFIFWFDPFWRLGQKSFENWTHINDIFHQENSLWKFTFSEDLFKDIKDSFIDILETVWISSIWKIKKKLYYWFDELLNNSLAKLWNDWSR
jgi:hypothetical protein